MIDAIASAQNEPVCPRQLPCKAKARVPGILSLAVESGCAVELRHAIGKRSLIVRWHREACERTCCRRVLVCFGVIEIGVASQPIGESAESFVSKTGVQRESARHFNIVLHKPVGVPHSPAAIKESGQVDALEDISDGNTGGSGTRLRSVETQQKVGKTQEDQTGDVMELLQIIIETFHAATKAERMASPGISERIL